MDNLVIITDSGQLNKIFENAGDKLVVLMFYTKNNPDCRRAKSAFEKSALNHSISYFCIIDMDKFEGESRYVKNISNMPKFDCYYQGNAIGSFMSANEKEIEEGIRTGERYVMMQTNTKNNMSQNSMGGMMNMNQMQQQINPVQIKQQILNNAMMQNPMMANQLIQNPLMLEQLVQRQIQQIQQQQMMQQQMMPQMPMMNMPNTNTAFANTTAIPALNTITQPTISTNPNVLPTLEQMQYYLKIFTMMQQMGILNTNTLNNLPMQDAVPKSQPNTADPDSTIVLPSGDKIIPLPNGKYGLIKKSS